MSPHTATALSDAAREQLGEILHRALADESALASVARDFHWNVTGPHFRNLTELFDEQYRELDRWIEKLGDRARSLGVALHTAGGELLQGARISPVAGAGLNAACMLAELISLHDRVASQLRADVDSCANRHGDAATAELLSGLIEYHETAAWILGELLEDRELAEA